MSETIEMFLQMEGITDVMLVRVPQNGAVRDIIEAARAKGVTVPSGGENVFVLLEDSDEVLELDKELKEAGIGNRQRVHCHRCRRIEVTINFNGRTESKAFPPSTAVKRVKRWADAKDQFDLKGVDTTDHVLQICGTSVRPDEDIHIGTLVRHPNCKLCFDLVPKVRVEG
jgi:hypothetical protein